MQTGDHHAHPLEVLKSVNGVVRLRSRIVKCVHHHLLRGIARLHHVPFRQRGLALGVKIGDNKGIPAGPETFAKRVGIEKESITRLGSTNYVEIRERAHAATVGIKCNPQPADTRPRVSFFEHRSCFLRDHAPSLSSRRASLNACHPPIMSSDF